MWVRIRIYVRKIVGLCPRRPTGDRAAYWEVFYSLVPLAGCLIIPSTIAFMAVDYGMVEDRIGLSILFHIYCVTC